MLEIAEGGKMRKEKEYIRTKFPPEIIKEAVKTFNSVFKVQKKKISLDLDVTFPDVRWEHNTEAEFFSDYRKDIVSAKYRRSIYGEYTTLTIDWNGEYDNLTSVSVLGDEREKIEKVFEVFESNYKKYQKPEPPLPPPPKPTIFIGHGKSEQWRDFKDHLHEKHGYDIEAYEIGARAGHAIRDILEEMLKESSIAFLVMTGEDETAEGSVRARQNVIHETGLFQGRLGFHLAIILLEEDTEEFSNIQGVQQIRFSKGKIKETYGEVLATIKREFPES